MSAPLLNIAALAARTGVSPDTLRKWEHRYGVLRPVRTAGGQRRYSEVDVQRVKWLRDRIREGWRIGEAARVLDESTRVALDDPGELRDALIASIRDSDLMSTSAALDQAFAVLPVEQALTEVVTPALQWTGDAWERGEVSVAQEHAVTGKVRAHLATLLAEDQGSVRGLAVLACAPGEQHDIGLTMLSVLLRADGWRVELLGADTPVDSAVDFAVKAGATMLCFSASRTESLDHLRASLRHPAENGLAVVLGGAAARPEVAQALHLTYAGERLDEAVEQLRHLARA
jgi:methanogenic corrinoid protein MtbC1